MDIERRDNDKLVEELRKEADDIETRVVFHFLALLGGASFHTPLRWPNTSREAKPSSMNSLPSIGSFAMKQVNLSCQVDHF